MKAPASLVIRWSPRTCADMRLTMRTSPLQAEVALIVV